MKYNYQVGPSKLYPKIKKFLIEQIKDEKAIIAHRGPQYAELLQDIKENMRDFWNIPEDYKIFFTYSATHSMEVLGESLPNDITHVINGDFGVRWRNVSTKQSKNIKILKQENRDQAYDLLTHEGELGDYVCITTNDTSTGIEYKPEHLEEIRQKYPDAALLIDATSSFGGRDYDITSADAWLFSVQKNMGLIPGLGVLIISSELFDKISATEKNMHSLASYNMHDLKGQPVSTPNILLVEGLNHITKLFKKDFKNAAKLDKYTTKKSQYFYKKLEKIPGIEPLCRDATYQSDTTFVLTGEAVVGLRDYLTSKGYAVSPGYGEYSSTQIRIANFPAITKSELKKLIKRIKRHSQYYYNPK